MFTSQINASLPIAFWLLGLVVSWNTYSHSLYIQQIPSFSAGQVVTQVEKQQQQQQNIEI